MLNTPAQISFSAQFGGDDGFDLVLPHFKLLKVAANGIHIEDFPFPKMAFILRVDGAIQQFGFSGAANPSLARKGEYISVDIGISYKDLSDIVGRITSAIMESIPIISTSINKKHTKKKLPAFNASCLQEPFDQLCNNYARLVLTLPKQNSPIDLPNVSASNHSLPIPAEVDNKMVKSKNQGYKLALQWPAQDVHDFDALIAIEDLLIETLPNKHSVIGHDFGSGQMNIFIMTEDPHRAFEEVERILASEPLWLSLRAGYSSDKENDYCAIWPEGNTEFHVV